MDSIAGRYAEHNVGAVFVYTNEAHPGEYYPHLTSLEQKMRHAHALKEVLSINRPILVDSLDGTCHRAYGSMPNMSWIFNSAGVPVYKADWTDAASIENALQFFVGIAQQRQAGNIMAPFRVERLDYRIQDRPAFYKGLERNGPKAVREFREAFG